MERGEYKRAKLKLAYEMAHCSVDDCQLWRKCFRGATLNEYVNMVTEEHNQPPRRGIVPTPSGEGCTWFESKKEILGLQCVEHVKKAE